MTDSTTPDGENAGSAAIEPPEFAARRAARNEKAVYADGYEAVARYLHPTDAQLACACLVAAGIPSVVADAHLVQTNALWSIAVGGARVLAPAARAAEARDVIAAWERGDFALPDDDTSYRL